MSTAVAGEIADNNRFDVARLAAYLRYKIPGFGEAIEVKQFQGGQSNPTYLIRTAVGRYVMRKKPAGELLASAHRIDREYRIMELGRASCRDSVSVRVDLGGRRILNKKKKKK